MNPFGTPGERAFYEMWAAENRRLCGRQDERDGVKVEHHPRIRHDSTDDRFWNELLEAERRIKEIGCRGGI